MRINYNGRTNANGIVTLTNVPNILTIESDSITGSNAQLSITIGSVPTSGDYYITINGHTITNKGVGSRTFTVYDTPTATANSIVKALRNVGLANYEIYQGVTGGVINAVVNIRAREVGEQYEIDFNSNLGTYITYTNYSGSSTDEFNNSIINVDVYSNQRYVTTLSKSYYKQRIGFDLRDVLNSISVYDYLTPYRLIVYSENGGAIRSLAQIDAKSAIGYMTNQGEKYISTFPWWAQNVSRGTQTGVLNRTVLYTYLPSIPVFLYSNDSAETVNISYKDASKTEFATGFYNINVYNNVGYAEVALDSNNFNRAYYVDLTIDSIGTIRYNIIKPTDATPRCQRVYFHNSYGGISFFDFTGQITEEHSVENETYTKNIYDYYRDTSLEETKIYDKQSSIVVTMKSHLMERSGIWLFNDFLESYDMWTVINGTQYKIICTGVKVDETETGVWQATATYTYSLI